MQVDEAQVVHVHADRAPHHPEVVGLVDPEVLVRHRRNERAGVRRGGLRRRVVVHRLLLQQRVQVRRTVGVDLQGSAQQGLGWATSVHATFPQSASGITG